jgi:hypothetical protein
VKLSDPPSKLSWNDANRRLAKMTRDSRAHFRTFTQICARTSRLCRIKPSYFWWVHRRHGLDWWSSRDRWLFRFDYPLPFQTIPAFRPFRTFSETFLRFTGVGLFLLLHSPPSGTEIKLMSQNLDRFFLWDNFCNSISLSSGLLRVIVKNGMGNLKIKKERFAQS